MTHIRLRVAQGAFLSQRTAEYPVPLGFAEAVCALFPHRSGVRTRTAPSLSSQGRDPQPQLRMEARSTHFQTDQMLLGFRPDQTWKHLRQEWQRWLVEKHILARLKSTVADAANEPLFDESEHGSRHHSEDSPTQRRPPRTGISQSCRDSLAAFPLWRGLAPCLGTELAFALASSRHPKRL